MKTKINKHISFLLCEHNCVVIPDFGGFVANYESARIDSRSHFMYAPKKSIVFNKSLQNNDGLLVNEIASCEGLTFKQAKKELDKYVLDLKESLKLYKKVFIEEVGTLLYTHRRRRTSSKTCTVVCCAAALLVSIAGGFLWVASHMQYQLGGTQKSHQQNNSDSKSNKREPYRPNEATYIDGAFSKILKSRDRRDSLAHPRKSGRGSPRDTLGSRDRSPDPAPEFVHFPSCLCIDIRHCQ